MNNLRKTECLAKFKPRAKLSRGTQDNLRLWISFLESAERGISINRVVFRKPTLVSFSDASEAGIGGYCPKTGIGWRYKFTDEENKALTLNAKEYLCSAIDMDFQLELDDDPSPFPCVLNMTDSTSAMGWIRKSNHDPEDAPLHSEISRFHATNMMSKNACNYSQHLPGKKNVVADSLSRDFHLSDGQIVSMLTSLHPSLSPSQIKIVQLPEKYTSRIASMAQRWPGKKESPKAPIKSTIAAGVAGWISSEGSATNTLPTPIWRNSLIPSGSASAVLSCMRSGEETLDDVKSRGELPARPSTMWRRSLWRVVGSAPSPTHEEKPTST